MAGEPNLIDRARSGDPAAWRELYVSHTGKLSVYLRAHPSGDTVASVDDLLMETWLVAAERIADFRGDVDDFTGWLFGIARNRAANARRRTHRRATDPLDLREHPTWQAMEDRDLGSEDWVRRTLAQLPPREAEVLTCLEVVGLDTATTARALDISTSAVRVARHRGLRRLRKLLTRDDEPAHSTL